MTVYKFILIYALRTKSVIDHSHKVALYCRIKWKIKITFALFSTLLHLTQSLLVAIDFSFSTSEDHNQHSQLHHLNNHSQYKISRLHPTVFFSRLFFSKSILLYNFLLSFVYRLLFSNFAIWCIFLNKSSKYAWYIFPIYMTNQVFGMVYFEYMIKVETSI